jgi:hypothetical protein
MLALLTLDEFKKLILMPQKIVIDVYYTSNQLFSALVSQEVPGSKQVVIGVLVEDAKKPFVDSDIDRLLLRLHELTKDLNNVHIKHLNVGLGVINRSSLH